MYNEEITMNKGLIVTGAKSIAASTGKALGFLQNVSEYIRPLTNVPFLGDTVEDLIDIVAMLNDYYAHRYTKLPFHVIVAAFAILAYLASPVDIIPDKVPILGYIDDFFVINLIVDLSVDRELERYRAWRETAQEL